MTYVSSVEISRPNTGRFFAVGVGPPDTANENYDRHRFRALSGTWSRYRTDMPHPNGLPAQMAMATVFRYLP